MSLQKYSKLAGCLVAWFSRNARDLPWRRTLDPYGIWVSEIMLQQTQVKTVIAYWERWMRSLPNVTALAQAKPERVLKLWEGLGYYTRARNLQRAAKIICEEHGGKFPEQFDQVLALPGIGRYTAGAICSIAFNQPTPILDGNTIRVLCRIFAIEQNPREPDTQKKLWAIADSLVVEGSKLELPKGGLEHIDKAGNCSRLNQAVMELGAMVCTPRNPDCPQCPVKSLCAAHRLNKVPQLPKLKVPIPATARRIAAFVVEERGRFLVRQRPSGVVNAHLWEFPNIELLPKQVNPETALRKLFKVNARKVESVGTIRHSITRYRITLEVYRATFREPLELPGTRWAKAAQLRRLPFTAAHRKIASFVTGL